MEPVRNMSGNLMRTCWEQVGNRLGTCRKPDESTLGTSREHVRNLPGTHWEHDGNKSGTCWEQVRNLLGTHWEHVGNPLGTHWEPVRLTVQRSEHESAPAESSPSAICAALSFLIWHRCSWIHSGFEGSSCVRTTSVLLSRLYFYLIIMIKIINYFGADNYLPWCGISFASNCHEWTGREAGKHAEQQKGDKKGSSLSGAGKEPLWH